MKAQRSDDNGLTRTSCNVNSTFNFTVGALAIAGAVLIGYFVYVYWLK